MVAGGKRDYAAFQLLGRERQNQVRRSLNLEGAPALQVFAFQEHAETGPFIDAARRHDRRSMRKWFDPLRRFANQSGRKDMRQVNAPSRTPADAGGYSGAGPDTPDRAFRSPPSSTRRQTTSGRAKSGR